MGECGWMYVRRVGTFQWMKISSLEESICSGVIERGITRQPKSPVGADEQEEDVGD